MPQRYVYDFDEPSKGGRELLGGKGIGLAEMTQMGVPVPAGFTITTDACRAYMSNGKALPDGVEGEIEQHLGALELKTGKRFGDLNDPLLVSVRSGAAVSMPGMMDSILNLGLNDEAVVGLARATGNERFANDSYRRLIQMYGEVVDGIDGHRFEQALTDLKKARGAAQDVDLSAEDLAGLIETYQAVYRQETDRDFPQDPRDQLTRAVRAVFDSWDSPRAKVYRRTYDIPDELGTAVNVVQMVFGNKGDESGTGVAFTRDPSTGEPGLYGEFLANAQGEDVVSGVRTPEPLARMEQKLPAAFEQLTETMRRLEEHYRDMQDIEFTVEDNELYLLQTRSAKRTAAAAVKAAVDMADEGLISREDAVARIDPAQLDQLLHPMIDPAAEWEVATKGLNASPGAACGAVVLDADAAEERGKAGESVILVRWETTPDDIHGLIQAAGILTAHGGMTSHAAVVARGMGKPCVAGCEGLSIDLDARTITVGEQTLSEGDLLTIDGGTGAVIVGEVPLVAPEVNDDLETILGWGDQHRTLKVRANADTPEDAAKAREFGAQGIGLCRTEHMFMAEERLPVVREMILADSEDGRRKALDRLLPMQQGDFEAIFEAMAGSPGDDPSARSAVARVLASARRRDGRADAPPHQAAAGIEPDAGDPRVPSRPAVAGDLRDAGAGDHPGGARGRRADGRAAARRDHAPARRLRGGAAPATRAHRPCCRGGGAGGRVPLRDDDRAAARVHPRRRDRRARRLLLLRDERSHADCTRFLARRRGGQVPHALPRGRRAGEEPVRDPRRRRSRRLDANRGRAGPVGETRHQARHLR